MCPMQFLQYFRDPISGIRIGTTNNVDHSAWLVSSPATLLIVVVPLATARVRCRILCAATIFAFLAVREFTLEEGAISACSERSSSLDAHAGPSQPAVELAAHVDVHAGPPTVCCGGSCNATASCCIPLRPAAIHCPDVCSDGPPPAGPSTACTGKCALVLEASWKELRGVGRVDAAECTSVHAIVSVSHCLSHPPLLLPLLLLLLAFLLLLASLLALLPFLAPSLSFLPLLLLAACLVPGIHPETLAPSVVLAAGWLVLMFSPPRT